MSKTIIVFFGPPGSGKGTQADLLAKKLKLPTISTGELLRQARRKKDALAKRIEVFMAKGKMVPEVITDKLLKDRLKKPDVKLGFMLDGYPRNKLQFKNFTKFLEKADQIYFVEIKVSSKEILQRLTGRRVCSCGALYHIKYKPPRKKNICDVCGKKLERRIDDTKAVIKERLLHYTETTRPMFKLAPKYGQILIINGEQDIDKIQQEVRIKLKKFRVL